MPGEDDIEGSSLTSHDMDTPPLYPGHHHKGLPHVEMVRPAQDTTLHATTPGSEVAKEEKKKSKFFLNTCIQFKKFWWTSKIVDTCILPFYMLIENKLYYIMQVQEVVRN